MELSSVTGGPLALVLGEDRARAGALDRGADCFAIDAPAGCPETDVHILPDASQMSGRGAMVNDCCFRGSNPGVAIADGETWATVADLTGVGKAAEGAERTARMGPIVGLLATMHISPEESQIKEFETLKLGGTEAALVVGRSLGGPDG
jgi:hypothetical protein